MNDLRNNIDSIAKNAFRDFEPTPPAHVWYNIVDELPFKPSSNGLKKIVLIAASLALLLGSSVWMYFVASRTQMLIATQSDAVAQSNEYAVFPEVEDTPLSTTETAAYLRLPVVASQSPDENIPLQLSANAQILPQLIPIQLADRAITSSLHLPGLADRPKKVTEPVAIAYAPLLASVEPRFESHARTSPVRVRLGSHLALQNNFRTLSYQSSHAVNFPFSQLENNILTFDAGLSLVLSSRSRFSFQTGIHYSTVGQFVNSIDIYQHPNLLPLFVQNPNLPIGHPQTVITSHGFIRLNEARLFFSDKESSRVITSKRLNSNPLSLNLKDQGLTQVFGFVEVPIVGRFLLYDRSIDIHIKGGIAANYLVSNQVFAGEGLFQQSIGETHGIRKFNFEGVAGLVFELPISPNLTFHLEPTAQFFFFPIVEGFMHFGRAVPYSYSIFTGIRYGF